MSAPVFKWPTPSATITLTKPITVAAGQTFDGQMRRYQGGPGMGDGSQAEGQKPLFILRPGAILLNVILGKPGCDGVHAECSLGRTTRIRNCYWIDVGEDAITVSGGPGKCVIEDCQFQKAADKVVQVNSIAETWIKDCKVKDFARFARACGTCGDLAFMIKIDGLIAVDGKTIMKISNKKGRGTIADVKTWDVDDIADASNGAVIKVAA